MKKTTKLLCGLFGVGLLATTLVGCATISNVENRDKELVYNGTSAVLVNDRYLYFGNSFADYTTFEEDGDYKSSAELSYLARLEAGAKLSADGIDYSPENVEQVAEEVVSHAHSFTFVLGDYIYYLTPNRDKFENDEGTLEQQYSYSTLFRSKLNGNKKKELYTTSAEISEIEVLKYQNKYYIVMLAGNELVKFELGDNVTRTVIADDAVTVALPKTYEKNRVGSTLDWNGNIYYTKAKSNEDNSDVSGTSIRKVSIAGGNDVEVGGGQGQTVSLVGRERDIIFYTYNGETYKIDTNQNLQIVVGSNSDLFSSSSVSDINLIYEQESEQVLGYIYTSNSSLRYKTNSGTVGSLTLNYDGSALTDYNVLLVSGRGLYFSTTNAIYYADLSSAFRGNGGAVDCRAIVKLDDDSVYDGSLYAFDGQYIYYYAKLQAIENEDGEEETSTDENYYLYRTKIGNNADLSPKTPYELLSLVQDSERCS